MDHTSNHQNNKKEFVFFDNLNKISIFRFYVIAVFIVTMLLLASLLEFQSKLFSGSVAIISILLLSKHYWFKNYVEWNDKIITLKFGYFKIKTIYLKKVDSIKIKNKTVVIQLKNKRLQKFDMSRIREQDIEKLNYILNSNKQNILS